MTPADVLIGSHALLLDFDGPICSVFAGVPAAMVADQLRQVLADSGDVELPDAVATSEDPFDVFRYAATRSESEARNVEAAFTAHEVEAIPTAAPTEGAHDLIQAWHDSGRPVAVVSNNSAIAIGIYLDLYGLRGSINVISARTNANDALLKPSPYLLQKATEALATSTDECVFIGDSLSDIEAARAAGIKSIGYANKPGKYELLTEGGADTTTTRLPDLVAVSRRI